MSAQYNSEYSGAQVSSSKCSYNTLCNYYGPNSTMPPVRTGSYGGVMITPTYGGIGYDALTHGQAGGCNQYFNIQSAYGAGAGSCSTGYTSRLCGGGCGGGQPGQKFKAQRGANGLVGCFPHPGGVSFAECQRNTLSKGPNTGVYDQVPQSNWAV